jgi:ABC-type amino acid transport substrate-binding protein
MNFQKYTSILLFLLIFAASAKEDECKKMKVSYTENWFPISWYGKNKELLGVAPSVLKIVAKRLNLELDFIPNLPWKRQLSYLEVGKLDVMVAMHFNKKRSKIFTYTEPFFKYNISLYRSSSSNWNFNDLSDLKSKQGVISRGASFGTIFDDYKEKHLQVIEVNATKKILEMVAKKRSDYFILPEYLGDFLIEKKKFSNYIIKDPNPVIQLEVHMGISKNSVCSKKVDLINKEIKKLRASGELKKIVQRENSKRK